MNLRRLLTRRRLAALCALALVAGLTVAFWPEPQKVKLTAYFPRTVSIYPGSDVRVLGIRIGQVTSITPEGDKVRVELEYDAKRKIPADAKAAIINSSVVSDRYVQLLPVYHGGPVMSSGAVIPEERTAVPVELDRIFDSLNTVSTALGPQGANADGALSRLLGVSAANLNGEGDQVHQTVQDLSQAITTLANGRDDLFGTVRNLQVFTAALAADDAKVRSFNESLAGVSSQLSGEREDLAAAVKNLAQALADVASFVHDNKGALNTDLKGLTDITNILVKEQAALKEFLDVAPTALGNLNNAGNPYTGTLDTRNNAQQAQDPGLYLCSLLQSVGKPTDCKSLQDLFNSLPKLPNADPGQQQLPISIDKTLGGILGGKV